MGRLSTIKPQIAALAAYVPSVPKTADAHYASPEHRAWRKVVVANAGRVCQGCGRRGGRLYADHIVELKDGGAPFDPDNGQALCASCHSTKTARARTQRQAR